MGQLGCRSPALAPNPRTVIVDFINYCSDASHPLPSHDSQHCAAMRHLASQLMALRYRELERLKNVYDNAIDIDFFLYRLCVVAFEERKSVGRLISIFAFAGILSQRPQSDNAALCDCVSAFIEDNLTDWLQESDSWNHICRLHRKNVCLGDTNWNNFCLMEACIEPAYHCAIVIVAAILFCCMLIY